jgi:SAM-dependent methyltransferase
MAQTPTDDRAKLLAHFAGDTSNHTERWSTLWDKGDFLPFDRGLPNPALEDMLKDQREMLGSCFRDDCHGERRRKKALVPGCGRGYDVLLLASFGYDAYGLEVSETAVKRCVEEQKANGHKYPPREGSAGGGRICFLHGDFFSDDWIKGVEGRGVFDIIYDYTVKLQSFDRYLTMDCAVDLQGVN